MAANSRVHPYDEQGPSHCECGSPLRFEMRDGFGERRSLALCANADCGVITTALPEGTQPADGLAACLLGPAPARRYLRPHLRLYLKSSQWGFRWFPGREPCFACDCEITHQLPFPRLVERDSDPYFVSTCLVCAATMIVWWVNGERIVLAIQGDDWDEPSSAVLVLKHVFEERAAMAREGWSWEFE
jgi:hypothetical protein